MATLTLNGQPYPLAWLTAPTSPIAWDSLPLYDKNTLAFCRDWLNGEQSFTVYTSGSTGKPKAINLSRAQMKASAQATGQALQLKAGDKALVCLFTEFIAGKMMLVRGLELGLALTVINPGSNPLADLPADSHFDFTALVPLQLQTILNQTPQKLPLLNRMKAILVGGAPISAALHEELQQITAPVYHTYGMTETVTHIALKRLNGPQANDYFVPLPGVTLAQDERGCLTITAPVTHNQTIITNDLVTLHDNGSFEWLGRVDNVINSGGVKVQVEKVESALEQVLLHFEAGAYAQRRFFVGPLPDPKLGQTVSLIFEGQPLSPSIENALLERLKIRLTPYEVPRQIRYLTSFRHTPTGKIDRPATVAEIRD